MILDLLQGGTYRCFVELANVLAQQMFSDLLSCNLRQNPATTLGDNSWKNLHPISNKVTPASGTRFVLSGKQPTFRLLLWLEELELGD